MKWKLMLQFLGVIIVITILQSVVNSIFTASYYNSAMVNSKIAVKIMSCLEPGTLNNGVVYSIGTYTSDSNVTQSYFVSQSLNIGDTIYTINLGKELSTFLMGNDSWLQAVDIKSGVEIFNISKPSDVKISYTPKEIQRLTDNTEVMGKYTIFSTPVYTDLGPYKLQYFFGVPNPKITVNSFIHNLFMYFTDWSSYGIKAKLVTTVITIVFAVFIGYLFARRLTKPVVNLTAGINEVARGDYGREFAEKGLYKEAYNSLNNTIKALKSNEKERKRTEKMREEWITNISHDLKTPLSSIKGYIEMMLEKDIQLTQEERKKYSEVILNKTNYMEVLLNDLKLTQRLKNALIPLQLVEQNIVDTVREAVIGVVNDPKYTGSIISFEPEEENITFVYDQMLIQRALANIIYNAVVHNPEGTEVHVGVKLRDSIIIEIVDNGNGIPEEECKSLFDRYYRGTNTDDTTGSGLGLAIAKQVIEAHGGSIKLFSEVGKGTQVEIIFNITK
ncbi:MAG: HAMP domain-containing sensor histidine kinase [Bacillota bacterium]|nr:HAMP domain-containing sensor histidine kinase [Bacillota bacterium]